MFGLSFLSPLFLVGALAAAVPVVIHLLHRHSEPVVDFSAMRFLRHAPVEQSRRRRITELLLLALRVAVLLLLAVAFARPFFTSAGASGVPDTIVLVDTSVSMTAPGQFERAIAVAREAIRSAPAGGAVGVMTFADGADVVAPLSADRAGALSAAARISAGAGATRYRTALARAARELAGRPGRIVVVTDLQESGWDGADRGELPQGIAVETADVTAGSENVAVTAVRVQGSDAIAVVHNFGERPYTGRVTFAVDGRAAGAAPVTLAPGASAEARQTVGASGALAVTVDDRAGYAADNVRHAVLGAAAAPRVLAVTTSGHPSESFYLARALGVTPEAAGFRFRAIGGQAFAAMTPGELADVQAIALLGTRGIEQHGRELLASYVRGGGGLLIAAGPDVDPAIVGGALHAGAEGPWRARPEAPLRFAPDDTRHPVFRVFGGVGTLANVSFRRASLVRAAPPATIVARYSDGSPALVEEAFGGGRVLLFASDLNNRWNDFPLQPAFVPFVHEVLKHLTAAREMPAEYLVGRLPGAAGLTPGVVALASRRVAVNVDPRESAPAHTTAAAFQANVAQLVSPQATPPRSDAAQRESGQRLWQYALLLMIVGVAAEGLLGRRVG